MWKNRIKDSLIFLVLALLCWMVFDLKSQQPRLAYMDVKKVFDSFELKKELQKKYVSEMEGKKRMIDSLGFEVQRMGIELENSGNTNKEKFDVFLAKRKTYMEMVKVYDERDAKMNSEYDSQIFKQLNQFIKEYGEEKNYTIIFGSLGNGTLMHADGDFDITNELIAYVNKKYNGEKE